MSLKSVKEGQKIAYRKIDLEQLRGFIGIEAGKYKRFTELRRNILEKAQRELNEKTDIAFEFKPTKKGRKVNGINFIIKHNEKFEAIERGVSEAEVLSENFDEAVAVMLASAVPELPKDIVNLLASKLDGISASQAFLSYSKAKQAGKVNDPAAYFLGILKHQEAASTKNDEGDKPHWTDTSWADGAEFDSDII